MPADDHRPDPAPLDFGTPLRVHVVGVGGAGMSAIATLLAAMGHQVTGSDLRVSAVTERLGSVGVTVAIGHQASNLGPVDVVTHSPAVSDTNDELVAARERGIPVHPRASVLAAIASLRRTVAVAGTHGKTTTSSMLSLILVEAGLEPSFLIGADVNEIGTNAVFGQGEWLVVEADESYGTFEALAPEIALLTNAEPDHLDHYKTFDGLRQAFGRYLAKAQRSLVGADDPDAAALGVEAGSTSVGTAEGATYQLAEVTLGRSSVAFDLHGPEGRLGRIDVPVPGLHNARNAAMAAVGALEVGAPFSAVASALARFAGVPRRFEFRGAERGVTFVDDYAHLPSEVKAAVAAARAGEWHRVVVVFQPHRYTRTAALASSFATSFTGADLLVVTDVYGAGEPPIPGVSGKLVADAVSAASPGKSVVYAATAEELASSVGALLRPGDLCLTLGAGDLTALPDVLLADPRW